MALALPFTSLLVNPFPRRNARNPGQFGQFAGLALLRMGNGSFPQTTSFFLVIFFPCPFFFLNIFSQKRGLTKLSEV